MGCFVKSKRLEAACNPPNSLLRYAFSVGRQRSSADFQSAVSQCFQPASRAKFRTHPSYPTSCRLEIGDTADWKSALRYTDTRRGEGRGEGRVQLHSYD